MFYVRWTVFTAGIDGEFRDTSGLTACQKTTTEVVCERRQFLAAACLRSGREAGGEGEGGGGTDMTVTSEF